MGRMIDLGRPREGGVDSVNPDDGGTVGAIGKKRAIPSGRSEVLMDLPYAFGVITGSEVLLSYTYIHWIRAKCVTRILNQELT